MKTQSSSVSAAIHFQPLRRYRLWVSTELMTKISKENLQCKISQPNLGHSSVKLHKPIKLTILIQMTYFELEIPTKIEPCLYLSANLFLNILHN